MPLKVHSSLQCAARYEQAGCLRSVRACSRIELWRDNGVSVLVDVDQDDPDLDLAT